MPENVDLQFLKEIFRARVLAMLKKEGLIDDDFIRMLMQWRHTSGFSVHNKVRIAREDTKGQEALTQISKQSETSVCHPEPFFPEKSFLSAGDRPGHLPVKDDPRQEQKEL